MRALLRPLLAAAVVAATLGGVGAAVAAQSSGQDDGHLATSSKKHHGKGEERGPRGRRGPRGKRGRQGPPGPAGSTGAQGPPGMGIQFSVTLATNVDPRTVYEGSGIRIEAGCSGGAVQMNVRATSGDHNIIEDTSFDNLESGKSRSASAPNWEVNIPIDMLAGGNGLHDYNGLLSVRELNGEVVTVQWFAMGSSFTPQGDCVVGGTASP